MDTRDTTTLTPAGPARWQLPGSSTSLLWPHDPPDPPSTALAQLADLRTLPGFESACGLPNLAPARGLPIGSALAVDPGRGRILPTGTGSDVYRGTRVLLVRGSKPRRVEKHRGEIARALADAIPAGPNAPGPLKLTAPDLDRVCKGGAAWALSRKLGDDADLAACEAPDGAFRHADPSGVSADARIAGAPQLGTLGGGGQCVQVTLVEGLYDAECADGFGFGSEAVLVLVRAGARGLGRVVSRDVEARFGGPDPLEGPPFDSDEGRSLHATLGAVANFALANRQVLTQRVRDALGRFEKKLDVRVLADGGDDSIDLERVGDRDLLVHRKAVARPAPGRLGVLLGEAGAPSFLMAGEATNGALRAAPPTAGRSMSRARARDAASGRDLERELARMGCSVQCYRARTLEEDHRDAHRDPQAAASAVAAAGEARLVARLRPVALVMG